MRIALGLEYDGAHYCGWQSQPSGCGVQDILETALAQMAGHEVRVHAAGRTDAGVHALSQVVHFDTQTNRPINAWVRGINSNLPSTLRVMWAKAVDESFHARFDAFQRRYQYLLLNHPIASALMTNKVGWFHTPLNVNAMAVATQYLLGRHDFSAFRAAGCQAKSPIKTMHRAEVSRHGDYLLFDFCANAFLHHQVRNMVGALIYIGKGSYSPDYMQHLLTRLDRTEAPPTFSPDGLYLVGVGYDAKWNLPTTERRLNVMC